MNRFFIIWISLSSVVAWAQFTSEGDREIARTIIEDFRRNCVQKVVSEADSVSKIKEAEAESKKKPNPAVEQCFRDYLSQITGVYFIYEKICSTLGANGAPTDDINLARQLINVNKYQSGTRVYHGGLNNCLAAIPLQKGRDFMTPYGGINLSPKILTDAIDSVRWTDPFPPSKVPYR